MSKSDVAPSSLGERPGRGPSADHCTGINGAEEGHHMVSISGGEMVRFVERCSLCGWIDAAALDRWAEDSIKNAMSKRAQRIAVAADTEPFAFAQPSSGDLSLEEVLFQALGAASMCWMPRPSHAEFDSARAHRIGTALMAEVNRFMRLDRQRAVSEAQKEMIDGDPAGR